MIDPKAVVAYATNLISQQYGPSLGPNIKQIVEVLAHSLTDAINAELKDLLEPVVHIAADADWSSSILDGLSNAPARWKCRSPGCPDRPAVTTPEAPRCYTCERPMQRAEWFAEERAGEPLNTLGEIQRKIATAGMMPAEILHAPGPRGLGVAGLLTSDLKPYIRDATQNGWRAETGKIPPPDGSSITALETALRAIPEISRCTMSEPHPGDLVVEVAFKPGLDLRDLNVLSDRVKEWLQAHTHAGVIVHYTGFVSYART